MFTYSMTSSCIYAVKMKIVFFWTGVNIHTKDMCRQSSEIQTHSFTVSFRVSSFKVGKMADLMDKWEFRKTLQNLQSLQKKKHLKLSADTLIPEQSLSFLNKLQFLPTLKLIKQHTVIICLEWLLCFVLGRH